MKTTQITLTGQTMYNPHFGPNNARKGYVAKITGRAPGAKKYEREFLGETADIVEGDEGLYERQRGDKKGGYTRWYHVVLNHPEHGLINSTDCEYDVPRIAKLLDDGHAIADIVVPTNLRDHDRVEGRMVFDEWAIRTPAQARKAAKSATLDSAVDACWEQLSLLPETEKKKVLTALRKRIKDAAD